MSMEFSFGVITYNHENLILELLESIKYQIITYGKGISVQLVVSDDSSRDSTVEFVKKWIAGNKDLFCETIVLESEKNTGTVENYKRIMRYIKYDKFKVIAGDDVFADNNVFQCLNGVDENFLATYVPITLKDGQVSLRTYWYGGHYIYMKKHRTHRYDVKKQEVGSYFYTPCTFYRKKLYTDYYEGQPTCFRLFEDDPLWHTILLKNEKSRVVFQEDYLVLYRIHENAVCSMKESPFKKEFDNELKNFKRQIIKEEKNIFVKLDLLLQIMPYKNRYLRIRFYIGSFVYFWRKFVCRYNRDCHANYLKIVDRLEQTKVYYEDIKRNAESLKREFLTAEGD